MAKHQWMTYDESRPHLEMGSGIDHFAYDSSPFDPDDDTHNGPKCKRCGLTFCEHCRPDLLSSECPGGPAGDRARSHFNDRRVKRGRTPYRPYDPT